MLILVLAPAEGQECGRELIESQAQPNKGMQRTRAVALPSCKDVRALAADAGR